eukprot:jgi/Chlat1/3648/Chrsp238S03632
MTAGSHVPDGQDVAAVAVVRPATRVRVAPASQLRRQPRRQLLQADQLDRRKRHANKDKAVTTESPAIQQATKPSSVGHEDIKPPARSWHTMALQAVCAALLIPILLLLPAFIQSLPWTFTTIAHDLYVCIYFRLQRPETRWLRSLCMSMLFIFAGTTSMAAMMGQLWSYSYIHSLRWPVALALTCWASVQIVSYEWLRYHMSTDSLLLSYVFRLGLNFLEGACKYSSLAHAWGRLHSRYWRSSIFVKLLLGTTRGSAGSATSYFESLLAHPEALREEGELLYYDIRRSCLFCAALWLSDSLTLFRPNGRIVLLTHSLAACYMLSLYSSKFYRTLPTLKKQN